MLQEAGRLLVPRDGIMDPDGATDSVRLQAASAPEGERRAFMDDRSICMHACSCGMWHVYSSGCGCSFMPMKVHGVACMPKTPRIGLGLMGITPWPANAGIGLSTPRSGQITNTTSINQGAAGLAASRAVTTERQHSTLTDSWQEAALHVAHATYPSYPSYACYSKRMLSRDLDCQCSAA